MNIKDLYKGKMLVITDIDKIVDSLYLNCEKEDIGILHNGCWVEVYSVDKWGHFEVTNPCSEYVVELSPDCVRYFQQPARTTINSKKIIEDIEKFNIENTINKLLDKKRLHNFEKIIDANPELKQTKD